MWAGKQGTITSMLTKESLDKETLLLVDNKYKTNITIIMI